MTALFNSVTTITMIVVIVVIGKACFAASDLEELRHQDPSLWPGHLEPFGSKQTTVEVETIDHWPEPIDFFRDYVEKNRPVAFKGVAKLSPAFKLFTDKFLQDFPGADNITVNAEPHKKEIRKVQPFSMTFKEFVQKYHNESLYMVDTLPEPLRKYVLLPACLRCEETKELLSSQVTWFSSGGTKSVLHNDDVDNINCLYRGSKQLLFIEYNKNKKFVPIDHPEGGYSSLDVDRVDYTKFPMLRHVDRYHRVTMEEGDCLFIPYHWFHQVNSFADGATKQNLAINVWFRHVFNHRPVECSILPNEATLDKFRFSEDVREESDGGGDDNEDKNEDRIPFFKMIENILKKREMVSFKLFTKVVLKSPMLNPHNLKIRPPIPEDLVKSLKEIFDFFDVDKDGLIKTKDLIQLSDAEQQHLETISHVINKNVAVIEDFFEDLFEDFNQEVESSHRDLLLKLYLSDGD